MDVLERDSIASGEPRIVERSSIPIKPMSIEEAVLHLDDSSQDFLVFRNSSNDRDQCAVSTTGQKPGVDHTRALMKIHKLINSENVYLDLEANRT